MDQLDGSLALGQHDHFGSLAFFDELQPGCIIYRTGGGLIPSRIGVPEDMSPDDFSLRVQKFLRGKLYHLSKEITILMIQVLYKNRGNFFSKKQKKIFCYYILFLF